MMWTTRCSWRGPITSGDVNHGRHVPTRSRDLPATRGRAVRAGAAALLHRPLATAGGAWAVLFVVPVIALVWVIITRTTATPARVTAHGLLGSSGMAWADLDRLEFQDSRWAVAVGTGGKRLRLPMVRPRDLPRLVAVSGGSLNLRPRQPGPSR